MTSNNIWDIHISMTKMKDSQFTWFIPRLPDILPDGQLMLGSILKSPGSASEPLNYGAVGIIEPGRLLPEVTYPPSVIPLGKTRSGELGLCAELLGLPVGGEISTDWSREETREFKIQKLLTRQFLPTTDFIEKSMENSEVKAWVNEKMFKKDIYMVTGLKLAYGASIDHTLKKEHGGKINPKIDLSMANAPVKLGLNIAGSKGTTTGLSFDGPMDFVFAYMLKRIKVARKGYKTDDYTKGAGYSLDRKTEVKKETAVVSDIAVLGEPQDVEADDFDWDTTKVKDQSAADAMLQFATVQDEDDDED